MSKRKADGPPGMELALLPNGADRQGRPLVVAVWVPKGGVAKTTLAAHLSASIAAMGKPTLVIDGDSQGSFTDLLADEVGEDDGGVWQAYKAKLKNSNEAEESGRS